MKSMESSYMFKNVFVGENAKKQSKRILMLGESHYKEKTEIDGTESVVKFLAIDGNDSKYNTMFYKNIMQTFGYDITPENRIAFWNKVFCGNYVDELCGKGEKNTAEYHINKNRKKYNNALFGFINENEIDVVVCFSRLVYNKLPGFSQGEKEDKLISHQTQYLKKYEYLPECDHKWCDVQLKKRLTVYGLRHPSAYFNPEIYFEILKNEIQI